MGDLVKIPEGEGVAFLEDSNNLAAGPLCGPSFSNETGKSKIMWRDVPRAAFVSSLHLASTDPGNCPF